MNNFLNGFQWSEVQSKNIVRYTISRMSLTNCRLSSCDDDWYCRSCSMPSFSDSFFDSSSVTAPTLSPLSSPLPSQEHHKSVNFAKVNY